jgi:HK97 family phage prohead protease
MKNRLQMICEAKVSLKKEADQGNPTGKIKARVTTWGPRDGADGRKFNYQPEGFADWADEFAKAGKPLPMFLNHNDMGMPVGEWNEFTFDKEGMTAEGKLFLNTVGGSDLYNVLKESPNLFGGVSVGAYADEACWVNAEGEPMDDNDDDEDESYFQITKGGLAEVSVVMYPNNPAAEVMKLEYFTQEGKIDLRVLEKSLRDAGISKHGAVTAASVFKKVLEQRDAVKAPLENAPTQSDSGVDVTEAEIFAALELRELSKKLDQKLKG